MMEIEYLSSAVQLRVSNFEMKIEPRSYRQFDHYHTKSATLPKWGSMQS